MKKRKILRNKVGPGCPSPHLAPPLAAGGLLAFLYWALQIWFDRPEYSGSLITETASFWSFSYYS